MKKSAIGRVLMLMVATVVTTCFLMPGSCFAGVKIVKRAGIVFVNCDEATKERIRGSVTEIQEIFKVVGEGLGGYGHIEASSLKNQQLLSFGIYNSPFPANAPHYLLMAETVSQTVLKYFNRDVKHESVENYPYNSRDGFYEVNSPDREDPAGARIDKVEYINPYSVRVYVTRFDETVAAKTPYGQEKAELQWVTTGSQPRYIVETWQKIAKKKK